MLIADVQILKKDMKERQCREKDLNVIIRGIPEKKKEKMHETMSNLLTAAGSSFNFSATYGALIRQGADWRFKNEPTDTKHKVGTRDAPAKVRAV